MVEGLKGTDSVQSDDNSQGRVNLDQSLDGGENECNDDVA